ncbi:SMI1/KNR4 family protein [Paenibacillus pasadenensis]|uniref:SMI1/KNR4 family protein n=1 Tax=Paenibacillus pasadenensis TaxID=217090 RepID=UPI00203F249C|nr:SMI1/KNR4 family protein [Paenibacillus pasadenensis]MCM3749953.1 SMI1/KNR4 family protein [Paenibacillus pasadenensis]
MLDELIQKISHSHDCTVFPPAGQPSGMRHDIPGDLETFYKLCGGMLLFEGMDYSITIVPPDQFKTANLVILGEEIEDDRSSDWFVIATDGHSQYITFDLNSNRLGRCYDSFHDRHGIAGSTDVIAHSFTELLTRLFEYGGKYCYWLEDNFSYMGDAYD